MILDSKSLEKTSSNRQKLLKDVGLFVDKLAEVLTTAYHDQQKVLLPAGIVFEHWPAKHYEFTYDGNAGSMRPGFKITQGPFKYSGHLIEFLDLLQDGWLDRVVKGMRRENEAMKSALHRGSRSLAKV